MIHKKGFFQFSKKLDAGLMLLTELYHLKRCHMGEDGCGESLSLKEASFATGVSFYFLQKVAYELRQAGYIESIRGKDGGYVLSSKCEDGEISLREIFEAIEGNIAVANCIDVGGKGIDGEGRGSGGGCIRAGACKAKAGMLKLNKVISDGLGSLSLKEFVGEV